MGCTVSHLVGSVCVCERVWPMADARGCCHPGRPSGARFARAAPAPAPGGALGTVLMRGSRSARAYSSTECHLWPPGGVRIGAAVEERSRRVVFASMGEEGIGHARFGLFTLTASGITELSDLGRGRMAGRGPGLYRSSWNSSLSLGRGGNSARGRRAHALFDEPPGHIQRDILTLYTQNADSPHALTHGETRKAHRSAPAH